MASKLSVEAAHRRLISPGSLFETEDAVIRGQPVKVWKNGCQTALDLFSAVSAFGDREFLVHEGTRMTYRGFVNAARRLALDMKAQGVGKGDVVAIILPNQPEWVVAYFAALLLGAIATPLNPAAPLHELEYSLGDCGAKLAVAEARCWSKILEHAKRALPTASAILVDAADGAGGRTIEDILGPPESWDALESPPLAQAAVDPDDDASIFYTSGTTGKPKGVLLTHRSLAYAVFHASFRIARRFLLAGETPPSFDPLTAPQQTNMVAIPYFHVSGSVNTLLPMMARGGKVVTMRWWTAQQGLRLIEKERVNIAGGVPIVVLQLLDHPAWPRQDRSSLQQVIYGGAPPPANLAGRIVEAGLTPGQNWGMTETAGAVVGHIGPEFIARPHSCGLPAPIHALKIVDETGAVARASGEVGEMWIRGPQVMKGYWNNPEATAEVLADGWLKTGDLAFLDEDGYCHIVDRAKDMLICAGENIYCGEIEAALAQHPAVAEAAALGLPHALFGEIPAAVVTRKADQAVDERTLQLFAAEQLAAFKAPHRILIRSEPLPRNDSGKVKKALLKSLFER